MHDSSQHFRARQAATLRRHHHPASANYRDLHRILNPSHLVDTIYAILARDGSSAQVRARQRGDDSAGVT
jgi:hypothetical protein